MNVLCACQGANEVLRPLVIDSVFALRSRPALLTLRVVNEGKGIESVKEPTGER